MSIRGRHFILAAGVLGALLGAASPALAQHGGGGGHSGGGGGGHFGGGGGHAGGGAHAAGVGHVGGGAHFAAAGGARFAGGTSHGYAGGAVARGYGGYAGYHGAGYGGRGGYGYPGGGYRHGYSTGAYWGGGYWRGGFWPRAYYGLGYSWFLPILPLAYATYWYSGIPYYYANDVYYTWNPTYDGYTATDPPPVTDSSAAGADGSAVPPTNMLDAVPSAAPTTGPGIGDQGQVFMYPKNGQTDDQQSTDKRECQQWASAQAGQGAANSNDYRRAMVACVEGRGYSAN